MTPIIMGLFLSCSEKTSEEPKSKTQPSQPTPTISSAPPKPKTKADRTCDIGAFVIDKDPKGLNVRNIPSSKGSKILGQIPTGEPVELKLVESKSGWFRIASASGMDEDTKMPQSGWVYGKLLGTGVRNYGPTSTHHIHKERDTKSPVVADPKEGPVKLKDCKGKWLMVEFNGKTGWLSPEGQCPSAVTNCS